MNLDLIVHSTCPLSKGPSSSVYPAGIADEWATGSSFREAGSCTECRFCIWESEVSDLQLASSMVLEKSLHLSCLSFLMDIRRISIVLSLSVSQEVLGIKERI